ncbi:MAG: trigger factor [Bacteroidetes bacterium]|nr:trigger factor [Bacteroidota bacterium]MBS1629818.1 trigger factor [Bacteroidota bacterium]
MATITREALGSLHEKITVALSKDDYSPAFEQSLKNYAKNANVPGFRKGKVPSGMVRKMYGQSVFQDEVLRSAGQQIDKYIQEQDLGIFGQPMILPPSEPLRLDMNQPQDFEFAFEIGLKPDFELPALQQGTALTLYKVQVSDEMLNDEVQRIARRNGKVENPEEITTKENILYANIQRVDEAGQPLEGAAPVEETILIEKLPANLQERLMGQKTGSKLVFRPVDVASEEELPVFLKDTLKSDASNAGQTVELSITKIGLLIPCEIDATLFSQTFPNEMITDEAGFRAKLREELSQQFAQASENRLNDEIYEMLVHGTPMQLPVPFLKRWMREGGEKPRSEAQVEHDFPGFDHQLRWTLISDKLIKDSGVEVSHEEVLANLKGRILSHFGMGADEDADWVNDYVKKLSSDEKSLNETYQQMLFGKLFAWLRGKFAIEEKEVGEKEFFALPHPHEGHHHH